MAKITRFYENVQLTTSGLEIPNVINKRQSGVDNTNIHMGTIDQIIVSMDSGSATAVDIELRYIQGNSSRTKLAYLYSEGALPLFVDSSIDGPFSLVNPDVDGDLHLYLEPDADCIVDVRIDLNIDNRSGL